MPARPDWGEGGVGQQLLDGLPPRVLLVSRQKYPELGAGRVGQLVFWEVRGAAAGDAADVEKQIDEAFAEPPFRRSGLGSSLGVDQRDLDCPALKRNLGVPSGKPAAPVSCLEEDNCEGSDGPLVKQVLQPLDRVLDGRIKQRLCMPGLKL